MSSKNLLQVLLLRGAVKSAEKMWPDLLNNSTLLYEYRMKTMNVLENGGKTNEVSKRR